MSETIDSFGIRVSIGGAIAHVVDAQYGGLSRDVVDMSDNDITDGFMKFIARGLADGGQLSLTILWDGSFDAVSHFTSRAQQACSLTLPGSTGTVISFNGVVTGFNLGAPWLDRVTADITVKACGAVTIN